MENSRVISTIRDCGRDCTHKFFHGVQTEKCPVDEMGIPGINQDMFHGIEFPVSRRLPDNLACIASLFYSDKRLSVSAALILLIFKFLSDMQKISGILFCILFFVYSPPSEFIRRDFFC